MGFLDKIFGERVNVDDIETPPCPHTSLTQRWDNPGDMGNKELATYECTSCGALFNYQEVRNILEPGEAQREADPAGTRRFSA